MPQQFWSVLDHLLETLQSSDGDESSVRAALEQLIPIVQDVLKTNDVLQTIGERPASVQKQDAGLTTDQVRELEKAKWPSTTFYNKRINKGQIKQVKKNLYKSAGASGCANSPSALFLREISRQRKSSDSGCASATATAYFRADTHA